MTAREALASGAAMLRQEQALFADAGRDAELLLLQALRTTRAALMAHPERPVPQAEHAFFLSMLERRLRFEPIQYILGEQEFFGMLLEVSAAVLIPRPETERLVEAVLERLPADIPLRIADVGTGSGAIAIALAKHRPLASIIALDLCEEALGVARRNVERHGLTSQIEILRSDLLEEVALIGPRFDAVVSNPPYIPKSDRATLHPQVREFEPALALFAGASGMAIYHRLIPQAEAVLAQGGLLAMEFGHGQGAGIRATLQGWQKIEILDDLNGIARVALARKA